MSAHSRRKGAALKVIPSLPDYAAGSDGSIWRVTKAITRSSVPYEIKGRIVKGRRRVKLMLPDGSKREFFVSRLVCEAFHGLPPSEKHHAAHWDGDCRNDSAANVRWATPKENVGDDKRRHGRVANGTRNGRAILTAAQVEEARSAYCGKRGQITELASRFGLSRSAMRSVVLGENWK